MKVIVAGHQKTGTKTLNEALTILGYKVYDFMENLFYLEKDWEKILYGDAKQDHFIKMYEKVDAVCDLPCLLFWEEIHKAFPDSKIILTIRDEDSWYRSLQGQLSSNESNYFLRFIFLFSPSCWKIIRRGVHIACMAYGCYGSTFNVKMNEMYAKLSYRRHNAHVLQNAPKDKLLVYSVKDGWEPLCKFLGVDVPDVPFPHKNKGANIFDDLIKSHDIFVRLKREAFVTFSTFVCATAGATYGLLKWCHVI